MWTAIGWVTSGFTLAAFFAAVAAWVIRLKILEKEKLLRTAPEAERGALVASALEFFNVDTQNLTKQQQFEIALQQIHARAQRFTLTTILIGVIAVIAAVTVLATAYAKGGPRPSTFFEIIDATTDEAVRCDLQVEYLLAGIPQRTVTVASSEQGRFDLSGEVKIVDVHAEGYDIEAQDPTEIRDGRSVIRLKRTTAHAQAIQPVPFDVGVSTASYEAALSAPDQPDPDLVAFTCQNDTKYTVDLFFFRYFPLGKRPRFVGKDLNGPVLCPRGKETLVWDTFGSEKGGAFYFFASVSGSKAKLITNQDGEAKPAYLTKSLRPQLVLTDRDNWFTGEVKHSTAQDVPATAQDVP